MPAIRGVYFTHPLTGVDGLWIDVTVNNIGIVGRSRVSYPAPAGNDTLVTYAAKIDAIIQNFLNDQQGGNLLVVHTSFSSLSPVTLSGITVTEGLSKSVVMP